MSAQEINPITTDYRQNAEPGFEPRSCRCPNKYKHSGTEAVKTIIFTLKILYNGNSIAVAAHILYMSYRLANLMTYGYPFFKFR